MIDISGIPLSPKNDVQAGAYLDSLVKQEARLGLPGHRYSMQQL